MTVLFTAPSEDPYKFKFLPSTIPILNNPSPHTVSSPTLDSFHRQLTHMETARFFNFTFYFHCTIFSFMTSCFIFRGYISHLTSTPIFKCTTAHTLWHTILHLTLTVKKKIILMVLILCSHRPGSIMLYIF